MRILYYNNCWFDNVGEAFIDIGCMHLIRQIFHDPQLVCVSNMNKWYMDAVCRREKIPYLSQNAGKRFHMLDHYKGDYLILAGMFGSDAFLRSPNSEEIVKLVEKGTKIIFLGLGQSSYSEEETDNFKRYLEKLKPIVVMTRDNDTYEHFKDCCPSVKGLDCAFWINEVYDPRNAYSEKYNVIAYNRSQEPEELKSISHAVHAWHMNWHMTSCDFKDNFFMSDTPYDYLTLYANADRVYTDLVHATIASLQYERHVKFNRVDNRGAAIDALEKIQVDDNDFCFIKNEDLKAQTDEIENSLLNYING